MPLYQAFELSVPNVITTLEETGSDNRMYTLAKHPMALTLMLPPILLKVDELSKILILKNVSCRFALCILKKKSKKIMVMQ